MIAPYLRGYGATRFRDPETMRSGQQAALAQDLLDLLDALALAPAALMGFDWGGRAACIVSALHPERVRCLVTGDGYNLQNLAVSGVPKPPESEHRLWYQYYFHAERGGPVWRRIVGTCADCCGDCGRRLGPRIRRSSTRRRPRSTIPTSSTS